MVRNVDVFDVKSEQRLSVWGVGLTIGFENRSLIAG